MTSSPQPPHAPVQNENPTKWCAYIIATFFGAGYGKPGPGTWGSVTTVLLWAACAWLFTKPPSNSAPPPGVH